MSAPDLTTRLVDFLCGIPAFADPANRSMLLNGLPEDPVSGIARHQAPRPDLYSIVQAALSMGRLPGPGRLAMEVVLGNTVPFIRGTHRESELDDLRRMCTASGSVPTSPASPAPTHGPAVRNRTALIRSLSRLTPADFATLTAFIPGAESQISRQGTVPEQVAELVRWAESPNGPGLGTVEEVAQNLRNP